MLLKNDRREFVSVDGCESLTGFQLQMPFNLRSHSKRKNETQRFVFFFIKYGGKTPENLCDWTLLLFYSREL